MKTEKISEFTTHRLSVYLRCLTSLEEEGTETTSSKSLAERFHLNSAQIRKDLACFGQFGVRGVGYPVGDLKRQISQILGLGALRRVCVVGDVCCEDTRLVSEQAFLAHSCDVLDELKRTQVINARLARAISVIEDQQVKSQFVTMKTVPSFLR